MSVVIPARDVGPVIGDQLAALSRQRYAGRWEVIVADNGSTDETLAIASSWRDRIPALRVVDAGDRGGAAHARNVGASHAHGDVIAFCDADDIVAEHWLHELLVAIADADVVGGRLDETALNNHGSRRMRVPFPADELPVSNGFLRYALGANLAVRATVFRQLGGFREEYALGDDVDVCWRAQLASMKVAFAPRAVVQYRYRSGLRALVRQFVGYGTIGPHLFADFNRAGMPPSPPRAAVGPWARLLVKLPLALVSPSVRGDITWRLAFRFGRLVGSIRHRVAYL